MDGENLFEILFPVKPETNRFIWKIFIVTTLIISFFIRDEITDSGSGLDLVLSGVLSLLITSFNNPGTKKALFNFDAEKLLFTDFDFKRSVLRSIVGKLFFLIIWFFWGFVIYLLLTSYSFDSFLISCITAFIIVYAIRILFEFLVSLAIVAENSESIKDSLIKLETNKVGSKK